MIELAPDVEQLLVDMSPGEFAALTARVRAPDIDERFRDIAAELVPRPVLQYFLKIANPVPFVDADGQLDEPRLRSHIRALFAPLLEDLR